MRGREPNERRSDETELCEKRAGGQVADLDALAIGGMSIFAGGRVILGRDPGYTVIGWLPVYNFTMGLVSAFFAAVVILKNQRAAWPTTAAILGLHAAVMVILQTGYREVVAAESVQAMTLRIGVWVVILGLVGVEGWKERRDEREPAAT